jgi:hypothetical protein
MYEDNQYTFGTNVVFASQCHNFPEKYVDRLERINGLETRYTLFSDGTAEINTKRYE